MFEFALIGLLCIVILVAKAQFSISASWNEISPNKRDTDGQPEITIAVETGNADIIGTLIDRVEIQTVNLWLSTTTSTRKLFAIDFQK